MDFFKAGSTALPTPANMTINDELIWSSDTGRTLSGKMIGDVVAEKATINLKWNILSEDDFSLLKSNLKKGFFPVYLDGIGTLTVYRGTIQRERWNRGNGQTWYRNISVDLIEA